MQAWRQKKYRDWEVSNVESKLVKKLKMSNFMFMVKTLAFKASLIGVPYANYVWLALELEEARK